MNAPAAPLAALPAVLPGIAAAPHDRDGSFPHGSLAALRDAGLLALTVPAAVGGGGAGLRVSAPEVETALRRFCLKSEAIGSRELGRRVAADHAAVGAAVRRLRIA